MLALFARPSGGWRRFLGCWYGLLGRQQSESLSSRDYSLSYKDKDGYVWRHIRNNAYDLAEIEYLCRACRGERDQVPPNIQKWFRNPNFYGLAAEFNGRIVHITLSLAQDNGQTVYSFGARTLPEFQRGGIFTNYFTAMWKLLHHPYLPNVKRFRGCADEAHQVSDKILQNMGLHKVTSFHVGRYKYSSNTPTEKVIEDINVGSTVRSLIAPSDGNFTSVKLHGQSSNQLEVVDSVLVPSGILFGEEGIVYSATTANLDMLMKQWQFFGSFDRGNMLTALSYGGLPCHIEKAPWWCTISALDLDKVEDVVKVNCRSALECSQRGNSGFPPGLVCYFTDFNAKNAADEVLSWFGFQECDSLPGYYLQSSHIFVYEGCTDKMYR